MQNKFCKALSNAISFRIPGDSHSLTFNPCCLYNEYLPYHPAFFHKQKKFFDEADQSYLPGCSKCQLKEKTHGLELTQRYTFNQQIPDGIDNEIYKLEIVLDTTCNAACIQCGSDQSSTWRKEIFKLQGFSDEHIMPETDIHKKIDLIKKNIDIQKVKRWHFWGGEPLLTDTHMKFLRQIEDLGSTYVAYTTNGSIFPDDEVLELWSRCKEVTIGISTDGTGDRFHYCRWPLGWEKWARNTLRFKNETPDTVRFHINYCVMPFNALYTDEVDDWLDNHFSQNKDGTKISYNFIRSEGCVDAACTPIALRDEIYKKLGETHIVSKIMKELHHKDESYMLKHLDKWDKVRSLNWREIFPLSARYFEIL